MRLLAAMFSCLLTFALSADLAPATIHGRATITQSNDGVRILVDRSEEHEPDGVVDDQFHVMIDASGDDPEFTDVLHQIASARVSVRARSITVTDLERRHAYVALLDGDPMPGEAARPARRAVTYFHGYGLGWSKVAATIDEVTRPRPTPESNAQCEAGGSCGALSCSIACINGESCSVSCATGYSACCYCGGGTRRNLAFCNCVSCTN